MKFLSKQFLKLFFIPLSILLISPVNVSAMQNSTQTKTFLNITAADGTTHQMEIVGWNHEIIAPRDAASGLPTGKRQHKPFIIIKGIDQATPLLTGFLLNDGSIVDWRMEVFSIGRNGKRRLVTTVQLITPSVSGIKNTFSPEELHAWEHVSFSYYKIVWIWQEGAATAQDKWESPLPM